MSAENGEIATTVIFPQAVIACGVLDSYWADTGIPKKQINNLLGIFKTHRLILSGPRPKMKSC